MNLHDLATIIGGLFMVLATLLAGALSVACALELIVRKTTSVWWIALYAWNRKEFKAWCRQNAATMTEAHANLVRELLDKEKGPQPPR